MGACYPKGLSSGSSIAILRREQDQDEQHHLRHQ
jgi:hypothetical protein